MAFITAFGIYLAHGWAHAAYSSVSATVGFPSPRDILPYIAIFYLSIFITGVVFLAFEVRDRDARSNMLGILDSRPYSNLDLVFGRFIGLFLCAWVPVVVLLSILQLIGWLLPVMGAPIGGVMAPSSIFSFAIYMSIPAIAFCCALVMLLTILVRQRVVAMVIALALLFGSYYLTSSQPYDLALTLDLFGISQVKQPSAWVNTITEGHWWLQRLGILFIALGLLFFTALIHPRLDGRGALSKSVFAVVLPVLGVACVFVAWQAQQNEFYKVESWRLAHVAKQDDPTADIIAIDSQVLIAPGQNIDVTANLRVRAQQGKQLKHLNFSLNPGFTMTKVTGHQGSPFDFSFENGMLSIPLAQPLKDDTELVIKVIYQGRPDIDFGYLDSALKIKDMALTVDRLAILDLDNAIFESDFVALMPGIHWLPTSGVDVGKDDARERAKDFYRTTMSVELPLGWTAVGPGQRVIQSGDNVAKFQFSPQAALPEVALIAAPFSRYSADIKGIEFEVLLHPDHNQVIEAIAPGKEAIEQWIGEQLMLMEDAGLSYPYKSFSLVEVPNTLRTYRGGWRMDSALAAPSMVMMKEKGFPTARFDIAFGNGLQNLLAGSNRNPDNVEPDILIRDKLLQYFANDFSGGSIFSGFAKSLYSYQTAATGPEAIAIDYSLQELTTILVSGERSYFSINNAVILDESLDEILDSRHQPNKTIANKVIDTFTAKSTVWNAAQASDISSFKPWQDPTLAIDVIALKYGKLAQALYDQLGPRKSGQLLAQIIDAHKGDTFDSSDALNEFVSLDNFTADMFEEWLQARGIPGFYAEQVQLYRLADTEAGERQYQLRFRIQNGEDTSGFARVSWTTRSDENRSYSDIIRIPAQSAVDFGLILAELPEDLFVEPYLALNREEFLVEKFNDSNIVRKASEPFDGAQIVKADKITDPRIIVDDLDLAFDLKSSEDGNALAGNKGSATDIDNNFYSEEELPRTWSRLSVSGSWGKYRKTSVLKRSGDGSTSAIFSSKIPQPGDWLLEVHLPDYSEIGNLGEWELKIIDGDQHIPVLFDARNSRQGWNLVGEYRLTSAEAHLEISDKTTGNIIIADAIAWTPAESASQVTSLR